MPPLMLFAVTEFLLSISPGPAVLLVISLSLHNGSRSGIAASLGVLFVNTVYFALSAIGVGAILASSTELFTAVKWGGAAYLVWTAYEILNGIIGRGHAKRSMNEAPVIRKSEPISGSFLKGCLVQASSIKNIIIFVSIIPQFIDPSGNRIEQFITLGIISFIIEFCVLLAYSYATVRLLSMTEKKLSRYFDGVAAGLMIMIAGVVFYT